MENKTADVHVACYLPQIVGALLSFPQQSSSYAQISQFLIWSVLLVRPSHSYGLLSCCCPQHCDWLELVMMMMSLLHGRCERFFSKSVGKSDV